MEWESKERPPPSSQPPSNSQLPPSSQPPPSNQPPLISQPLPFSQPLMQPAAAQQAAPAYSQWAYHTGDVHDQVPGGCALDNQGFTAQTQFELTIV